MDSAIFNRTDIRRQLSQLGYDSVPDEVVNEFWTTLQKDPLFQLKQEKYAPCFIHQGQNSEESKKQTFRERQEPVSTFGIPREPIILDDQGRKTNIYELKRPNIVGSAQKSNVPNNSTGYDPPLVMNSTLDRTVFPDVRYIDVQRAKNYNTQMQNRRPTTASSSGRSGRRSSGSRRRPKTSHGRRPRKNKRKGIRTKQSWKSHPKYGRKHDPLGRYKQFEKEWKNSKFLSGIGSKRMKLRYQVKQEMLDIANRSIT